MTNIISPCILLSLLGLLVFWLPCDSGEKVALEITVMLSFSVFLIIASDNLPVTSDNIPLISKRHSYNSKYEIMRIINPFDQVPFI